MNLKLLVIIVYSIQFLASTTSNHATLQNLCNLSANGKDIFIFIGKNAFSEH